MAVAYSIWSHGHCKKSGKSPTYRAWRSMMQRCYREKDRNYPNYGARGITVCEPWHRFNNFLFDMGIVPPGMQLDRINNNGNYSPENCRWANRSQQARNKRNTAMLTVGDTTLPMCDWADRAGLKVKTLKKRLKSGWPIEMALNTPALDIAKCAAMGGATRWRENKWAAIARNP